MKDDTKGEPTRHPIDIDNDKKRLNRDRQRRYRQRALKDPDGLLLTRLQVMISANADGCLSRICETTRMTKREAIEMALIELESTLQCNRERPPVED